jgi:hypothetical protein
MPTRLFLLTALFLLALAAPASAVIVPGKGMAGVELQDCQERVIEVIGPPDRTFGKRDVFGFVSTYWYNARGLKLEFRKGPGRCLVLGSIRTTKGQERTKEGVGKGTMRKTLRAKLRGEKCRTFTVQKKRHRICWLGSFTPARPITEFRIDSKGRVNNIRVAYVID